VAYEFEGERYESFPPHQTIFNKCIPIYEELPGWEDDITAARAGADLPKEARGFLESVEEVTGTPISWVSVGPGRDQIVKLLDVA